MAHGLARRVEEWGRGFLQPLGAACGLLGEDGRRAEELDSSPPPCSGGVLLDLPGQIRYPLPVGFRSEMLPAGEGREDHRLGPGVLERVGIFSSPATGGVFLRAVEPGAGQGLAGQDLAGRSGVLATPGARRPDLLDSVAEDVPKSRHLRIFLAADQDRLVAPIPDLPRPAGVPAHLPRQVRVEVGRRTAPAAWRSPLGRSGDNDWTSG